MFRSSSIDGRPRYDVSAERAPTTNPQLLNSQRISRQDKWRARTTASSRRVKRKVSPATVSRIVGKNQQKHYFSNVNEINTFEKENLYVDVSRSRRRTRFIRSGRRSYLTPTGERDFGMKLANVNNPDTDANRDNSSRLKNHQVSVDTMSRFK